MKVDRFIYRLDRVLAWILYLFFLLMMTSGYMITRGFLSYRLGVFIHAKFDVPIMILLSVHTTIDVRGMLMRKGVRQRLLINLIPILFSLTPLTMILYLDTV